MINNQMIVRIAGNINSARHTTICHRFDMYSSSRLKYDVVIAQPEPYFKANTVISIVAVATDGVARTVAAAAAALL